MKNKDFPNYFIAGDSSSLKAQSTYVSLVKWDLLMMVLSAVLSIYNFQNEDTKTIMYVLSGLLLLAATVLSFVIKNKKFEDIWYRGRALAESCKTLTWRYIMCSEYFDISLNAGVVEARFIERIRQLAKEFKDLDNTLSVQQVSLPIITDEMRRVRGMELESRKKYYLQNRIDDQIKWYATKADTSKAKYERWFNFIIILQVLSLISITYLIRSPMADFNFVGLFSTMSASGFSWLQLKKYQENKEAYTTAASELNIIKAEGDRMLSENEFSKYVLDSENAMSREHTMWLAQKRA